METVRGWTEEDLRRLGEVVLEGEHGFKGRRLRSRCSAPGAPGASPTPSKPSCGR